MHLLHLAACVSLAPLALAVTYCPPLGPVFPAPRHLSNDPLLRTAAANLSATIDALLGPGNSTSSVPFNSTITSFSLSFFSIHEPSPLFEYHHTAEVLNTTANGTRNVTADGVYRLGSITKVVTVLALMLHEDKFDWSDPITKYVPELAGCADNGTRGGCVDERNQVEGVRWNEVTLGALAAQLSGIPRDYAFGDIAGQALPWSALGFPTLNESDVPPCGLTTDLPACTREQYLSGFKARHPVFPPFATPVYSNAAFSLLGLALEVIAGNDYETILQNDIFGPLHMSHSSLQPPPGSVGVIPVGPSNWGFDIGVDNPAGGLYSSTTDLATLARAILNSTLLPPSRTRRWLKPQTHTSSLTISVGAPWEIGRSTTVTADGRVVDFYTKSGGLGLYSALMVLVPDYDVGLTVLVAGDGNILNLIVETALTTLLPAVEAVGRAQAAERYAGVYESPSTTPANQNSSAYETTGKNSSILLTVDRTAPGLHLARWVSNGTDVLREYAQYFAPAGGAGSEGFVVDARLYPTGLTDSERMPNGSAVVREAFRAVFQVVPAAGEQSGNSSGDGSCGSGGDGVFPLDGCTSWGGFDGLVYGNNAVDEFVFHFDAARGGAVVGLESRVLRAELMKVG